MRITFLAADVRLAKTYTPTSKTPYPHAKDFTSTTTEVDSLNLFTAHVRAHAQAGHCLLKGEILHELHNESRAGSTDASTPTTWICLDLDRCPPGMADPEDYIRLLPAPFHNASYLWHWSNSAGFRDHFGGHLFFLLTEPIDPKWLKRAITAFNFTPPLDGQIRLSQNGLTLSYGLDPTTAQNDKLLFIADPILQGIPDPFEGRSRFALVHKEQPTVDLDPHTVQIQNLEALVQSKLAQLRKEAGLPARKATYKTDGNTEYLKNPERGVFRGPYIDARGFRYGNLNDGDSYAYFHTLDNPKYLHNFKGEPVVRLQDIDPDYWQELTHVEPADTDHRYTIFRDRTSDTYQTLDHDLTTNTFELYPVSNLPKAQDFLRIHRQEIPESTPLWDIVFEPDNDFVINYNAQRLNMFQKTSYLKNATPSYHCPPAFDQLTLHVVGSDPDWQQRLINWIAAIIQRRQATHTSFLLHGRTGTGKGVLFHTVLKPILGADYCPNMLMEDLDTNFNEWMETALLVLIDEAQVNDSGKGAARANKIKNMISEPTIAIRRKFANVRHVPARANFIFAANEHDAITLQDNDRRFHIPPRQENPIPLDARGIQRLTNELQAITNYLIAYPVNDTMLSEITMSAARQHIIDVSKQPIDLFIDIILQGDLDTLVSYGSELETAKNAVFRNKFLYLIQEWQRYINVPTMIPVADLRATYNFLFNTDIGPVKFGKMMANKNVRNKVVSISGVICRCTLITWRSTELTPLPPLQPTEIVKCLGHTLN